MRATRSLAYLRICTDLPKWSLLDNTISTKIFYAGSLLFTFILISDPKKNYTSLSLRLYDVLESIGASTEMRKRIIDRSTTREVLASITNHPKRSVYMLGSGYEGTLTQGSQSDVDIVHVREYPLVIDRLDKSSHKLNLLQVHDEVNPPGYVKLQVHITLFRHSRMAVSCLMQIIKT